MPHSRIVSKAPRRGGVNSSSLRILTVPNPLLTEKCKPVRFINREILNLVDRMTVLMRDLGGHGISAPQIGRLIRVVVLHVDGRDHVYINPVLSDFRGHVVSEEHCLSIPGPLVVLSRWEHVHVKANDLNGISFEQDVQGKHAIILQHEVDHLDGMLILPM